MLIDQSKSSDPVWQKILLAVTTGRTDGKLDPMQATIIVSVGLMTAIDSKLFLQAVDKLLAACHTHSNVAATAGLAISVALLQNSLYDRQKVQKLYLPQIQSALLLDNGEYRRQRFEEIKECLLSEQNQQVTMGVVKAFFTVLFGYVAMFSPVSILNAVMWVASLFCGTAAAINAYNYQQFQSLLNLLRAQGHIQV